MSTVEHYGCCSRCGARRELVREYPTEDILYRWLRCPACGHEAKPRLPDGADWDDPYFDWSGEWAEAGQIIAVMRECAECGTAVLVLWRSDVGAEPAPKSCAEHS